MERQNQYDVQSYRTDKMKCTEFLESGLCESTRKINAFVLIILDKSINLYYMKIQKKIYALANYLGKYRI